ncbi:MAG: cell wall-binding repeat-containing protein [Coriobacteriia bacterium]
MNHSKLIRFFAFVCVFALVASIGTLPAQAVEPLAIPDFTIHGGGYGHGIGLSQYGSQGFALKGWTYDNIVKHYFQGTTIATAKNLDVRVYLDKDAEARSSWTLRAIDSTLTVYSGDVSKNLTPNGYYKFTNVNGIVTVTDGAGKTTATFSGDVTADPYGYATVFEIKDVSGPKLNVDYPNGYPYMRYRGKAQLVRSGTNELALVNMVPFQYYLYGVVPRESFASWDPDALKAQAIVARSYAKAKIDPDDDGIRDANLKCTTADQVYGGHSRLSQGTVVPHEASTTNAAVDATDAKVVKNGTTIVQTFFFSSSGGHTANIEDSWGYSTPQPYFVGVDDPYEGVASCPDISWEVEKDGMTLAANLKGSSAVASELSNHGLPAVPVGAGTSVWVTGVTIEQGVSGYPRWVTFRFSTGASVKLTSYTVKSACGLKSPNFTFSGFPITRISGSNRYDTAVALSKKTFPGTAPAVVIASGDQYADALTGSALAGAADGALLLTHPVSLPTEVSTEIKRLQPSAIYILGGTSAVSAAVESAIKAARPTATVQRISGVDRYETSRKVADKTRSLVPNTIAVVVSGETWPDAASVSALAYAKAYPILLIKKVGLTKHAAEFLAAAKPATTLVVGGTSAIGSSTEASITAITAGTAKRLSGSDRYSTAAAVARHAGTVGFTFTDVYIATGEAYADALAGGMLAGARAKPLILTHRDSCPSGTAALLREKRTTIGQIWLLGGTGAISDAGLKAIDSVMME